MSDHTGWLFFVSLLVLCSLIACLQDNDDFFADDFFEDDF